MTADTALFFNLSNKLFEGPKVVVGQSRVCNRHIIK